MCVLKRVAKTPPNLPRLSESEAKVPWRALEGLFVDG